MDINDAKAALKDGYLKAGLELVDEHQHELFFKYMRGHFRISENEISEYATSEQVRSTLKAIPVECGICSPNYREHMVVPADPIRGRMFFPRDREIIFGDTQSGGLYVEIAPASTMFADYFRFEEAYLQLCLERMRRPFIGESSTNERYEVRDHLYRPLTIRVHNISEPTPEAALKRTTPIIDACLFELSYLRSIVLTLAEEWPRRQPRVRPFQFGETVAGNQLPLPNASFNADTIRFYQRGMATDDPANRFLAFYQVLEYYFVAIADEQLYSKLSRRINDPKFSAIPANLDRLIQDVTDHKQVTDELEMLKAVIGRLVDENELIEFIQAYEAYLGDKIYTKRRTIFGEEVEVKLTPGHVVGNIAKTVKTIRNALVHSSDRYERKERYIPSASSENMIKREIPLMRFLAERVIIASAK